MVILLLGLAWSASPKFAQVATGEDFTCGRTSGGDVWCWGNNEDQQLGVSRSNDRIPLPVDTQVRGAVDLAAAGFAACAVLQSGRVQCWGQAFSTEWGRGSLPRGMGDIRDATQVSLAPGRGCVRRQGGRVSCWELDAPSDRQGPYPVPEVSGIDEVAVGRAHTCARTQGGDVWCWGDDKRGQLGQKGPGWPAKPIRVPGVSGAVDLSSAGDVTCVATRAGAGLCWGPNDQGQLGLGHTGAAWGPQSVLGLTHVRQVSVGRSESCVLDAYGAISCWGADPCPRPGVPTRRVAPVEVPTGSAQVLSEGSPGEQHCARVGGALWCWGYNSHQQATTSDQRCVLQPELRP